MTEIKPVQVTIKKNQGITHALRDHVKENDMKLSDNKITKSEWEATIKVLDEINKERKASGKGSIFKKRYIVYEGAKINFTENEMEKLYNAMGVELSNKSQKPKESEPDTAVPAQQTPQEPVQTSQEAETLSAPAQKPKGSEPDTAIPAQQTPQEPVQISQELETPSAPAQKPKGSEPDTAVPVQQASQTELPKVQEVALPAKLEQSNDTQVETKTLEVKEPAKQEQKVQETKVENSEHVNSANNTEKIVPEWAVKLQNKGKEAVKLLSDDVPEDAIETFEDIIYFDLNSGDVKEFLRGYEANKGEKQDSFFSQLYKNKNYQYKDKYIMNVASLLTLNAAKTGKFKAFQELDNMLKDDKVTQREAKKMDKILQEMLENK